MLAAMQFLNIFAAAATALSLGAASSPAERRAAAAVQARDNLPPNTYKTKAECWVWNKYCTIESDGYYHGL